jgi:hypothetical protein
MTAHWIEVKDEKWSLRSEVVGFKAVSGDHSGWNLGRYFVGMCDRVGICSQEGSKVRKQAKWRPVNKSHLIRTARCRDVG